MNDITIKVLIKVSVFIIISKIDVCSKLNNFDKNHEMYREKHLTVYFSHWIFDLYRYKNSDDSRTMQGDLGTAPYVSSLATQCNRRDNRRAVPANDGTIIRSPWEFSEYSNDHCVHDMVVLFSAFLRGFAINLSMHYCVVRFRRI